jgi:spore coat protein U-like protein
MRRTLRLIGLLLALCGGGSAHALCVLVCSCSVSAPTLNFGNINPWSSGTTVLSTSVRVSCSGVAGLAIPYRVDLSKGGATTYAGRRMTNGASALSYNLYLSNGSVWGDGSEGTGYASGNVVLDVLGLTAPHQIGVEGRVPGSQNGVSPVFHTDNVVMTLTYF